MQWITSLIAFAGLVGSAVASPIASPEKRTSSFRVKQVQRGAKIRSGAVEMERVFAKFTTAVPSNIRVAAAAAVSGSATTTPERFDSEFLTPVMVGGTTLMLNIDTGSSDLWVFSNQLPASESTGHSVYTVNAAKKLVGDTFSVSFGDGSSASGNVFADTVVVGGVTATRQAVEAATSVSASFTQDTNVDGLMGLAFSPLNTVQPQQQRTFFDNVKSTLDTALFAADLISGGPGEYDFGFIDTAKFTGTLDFSPVDNSLGLWEFTTSGYAIGTTRHATAINGIADTGTTLLLLPSAIVTAYYAQVKGIQNSTQFGGFIFPCNAILPTFSLIIDSKLHTVPSDFLNFAPVDAANTNCFGGIQSAAGLPFSIFGGIFLKSQYAVFDMSQATPRIGFGQQTNT
ncbi:aspartic protease pep1 [Rhizodiscina lignyota]|uniref:Aspartic protease pep1 n=1 Tax=Rhizodiscina lignyota TaxID=1504668 RepID=A0A9P4I3W9_9PEZI|nr:aspartic protease pep1 [Rhizodiscina lignyota]